MTAVVDASALLHAASDERDPVGVDVRALLPILHRRFGVAAPALLAWELGNVVHCKDPKAYGDTPVRRAEVVGWMLESIELVAPDPASSLRAARLAKEHRLSFYDAAYLEVAARDAHSVFVTQDAELLRAARRKLGARRAFDVAAARRALAETP